MPEQNSENSEEKDHSYTNHKPERDNSSLAMGAAELIALLSPSIDLVGLRTYIAKRTSYGRKPGRTPWQHTRAYLAQYSATDPDAVVGQFEAVGVRSDVEVGRWLLQHDELVP